MCNIPFPDPDDGDDVDPEEVIKFYG